MENTGIVYETGDKKIKIKIVRDSACGSNCQSCGGCELKNHFIEADRNDFSFNPKTGDSVKILMDNKVFYTYSVLGYAVFVVFMVLGCIISWNLYKDETLSVIGAFAGIGIAFVIVKLIFMNKKTGYKIEKVEK